MEEQERKTSDSGLNRLLAAHMLYSFVAAALAVLVPLYLLEMDVDVAWIGVILSLGPISFMVVRITLASMADDIGTKAIAAFYSISNLFAIAIYLLFIAPLTFAIATFAEGIRASGFWAIARTEVFEFNGDHNPGETLARFSNMRQLADGLGRLCVGLLIAFVAFQGALIFLLALSVALLILALTSKERSIGGMKVDSHLIKRIFKPRPASFWYSTILQLLIWLPYNMLFGFLLPLYLTSTLKMGYAEVGLTLAVLSIATAGFALLFVKLDLSKNALLALTAFSVPALVAFPLLGSAGLALLAVIAIGIGCVNIIGEYILVDQVYRSKDVSTDIGVLYAPLKIAEFFFLLLGGMVIGTSGYAPLFFVSALSIGLFVALGRSVLSSAKT
ncbi:MAG: MFS transporter [Candidatus Micrarchaeota archaeon]